MTDKKSSESRRKLLKSIAAGSGAVVAGKSLPDKWTAPVVDSVMLPAHAQTSPATYSTTQQVDPCAGAGEQEILAPTTTIDFDVTGVTPTGDGTLEVIALGDLNSPDENWEVSIEGTVLGFLGNNGGTEGVTPSSDTYDLTKGFLETVGADNTITVTFTNRNPGATPPPPDVQCANLDFASSLTATLSFPATM